MATVAVSSCSVCLDDDVAIAFACSAGACAYQMCEPCIKHVLGDSSATNSKNCPMCKNSTGIQMVEAVAGKGAIRIVEQELRSSVEFDVENKYLKKQEGQKELDSISRQAREIFNDLSEALTMKCPRCKTAFHDYDGCNALTCRQIQCRAAFCAICLQDCGGDAHNHVRQRHGDLFDKAAFERSRLNREKVIVQSVLDALEDECFELKQMVRNQIELASLGVLRSSNKDHLMRTFVAESRDALKLACRSDRLSILRNPEERDCLRRGLTKDDISPRLVIPDEYRVHLRPSNGFSGPVFTINVTEESPDGYWIPVSLDKLEDLTPTIDILANLKQSFRCGVIAVAGEQCLYQSKAVPTPKDVTLGDEEVCIALFLVNQDGELSERSVDRLDIPVIGLNQNLRMTLLSRHVDNKGDTELLFDPLKHLIGVSSPRPIIEEILNPLPISIDQLNAEQKSVAHPLCIKTSVEVAGPPGTGKTKTITELVRSLLQCTTKNIVVLSERNGAIDAIAEKFVGNCLVLDTSSSKETKLPRITDLAMWNKIMTFGAATVGPSTELFMLQTKLSYHPELVRLREKLEEVKSDQIALTRKMRNAVAVELKKCNKSGSSIVASKISDDLKGVLNRPGLIISYVEGARNSIEAFVKKASSRVKVKEEDLDVVVELNSNLLDFLSLVRPKHEREQGAWDEHDAVSTLKIVYKRLSTLLSTPLFDEEVASSMQSRVREQEEELRRTEQRLTLEMPEMARLRMSTIGSSHKLLGMTDKNEDGDDLTMGFQDLVIEDDDKNDGVIVIFDEAGCIPSYELLGLTRLGSSIEALILVGDKNQLPPYESTASYRSGQPRMQVDRYGARRPFRRERQAARPRVKSLLDISRLSFDNGERVKLTTQYRVPKDIADLLNDRVYRGDYKTSPQCKVPSRGIFFVGVQPDAEPRKKYVNKYEVQEALDIIFEHTRENFMILTPYKNQQREFEFQLKRLGMEGHKVLTIDQCQGQEADNVILSLVQKPTRFLNKNRLNVALSRVRQKLYILTDKREFRKAAQNTDWDCHLIAKDLLSLWDEYI